VDTKYTTGFNNQKLKNPALEVYGMIYLTATG